MFLLYLLSLKKTSISKELVISRTPDSSLQLQTCYQHTQLDFH